jgi:hypothetical protein
MEADFVDVGIGDELQASPWGCPACHYVEDGELEELKEKLKETPNKGGDP